MRDEAKTKAELIAELAELRARLAALNGTRSAQERAESGVDIPGDLFRAAFHLHPDPALLWERLPDGRIVLCQYNRAALERSRGKLAEFQGATLDDFFAHDHITAGRIRRVFATGESERAEVNYTLRTTEENTWLLASYVRLSDSYVFNSIQDITERVRMEAALRESEARLRSIAENTEDMIFLYDTEGRIQYYNAPAQYGVSADEVLGKTVFDFFDPQTAERLCDQIEQVAATGRSLSVESQISWRGQQLVFLDQLFPLTDADGNVTSVAKISRNITDRKQIEEALQERNRDLNLLNRAGQALTSTLDVDKVLERVLETITEVVGAEGGSVWLWDESRPGWLVCRAAYHVGVQQSLVGLALAPGQGIAGWAAQQRKSTLVDKVREDPRFAADIDAQTGYQTEALLVVPLVARDAVLGVLEAVNGDFNADHLAVIETLAASAAIAIQNAQLVDELRRRNRALESSNEELDAYAHTVAHDLRNPLGIILGHAQVAAEIFAADCQCADTEAGESLNASIRAIARHSVRMSNIINELLLLASVRRMDEVETMPLDTSSIVLEAQERLSLLIEERQAQIIMPDVWPVAEGHGPWVEEVWSNYLGNAIHYGGTDTVPPRVELGADVQPDGMVRFWVRDNGPGLTPEEQRRLFTPFTRLEQARARGHGLGLSIVRRIVEKLGGQVGVESEFGKGSTFYFTLPAFVDEARKP
ncbi:MAG: PAS domain-containing protein [Anaerolineae bacterium]